MSPQQALMYRETLIQSLQEYAQIFGETLERDRADQLLIQAQSYFPVRVEGVQLLHKALSIRVDRG